MPRFISPTIEKITIKENLVTITITKPYADKTYSLEEWNQKNLQEGDTLSGVLVPEWEVELAKSKDKEKTKALAKTKFKKAK